jgi:GAF domain-containing protein
MTTPHPSSALLGALREFTAAILNPYDLHELLHRLLEHATTVTDSDGAGIMLAGEDGLGFASASDDRVVQLEILQDRIETGACYEAFTTNQLVLVDDLGATDRWPPYQRRALELGFRSVIGVPLNACGQTIGVLNIYRHAPGSWSPNHIEAAEILASMGAGYVLHATEIRAQHELADQLHTALVSRDTIGQAKGILMTRHNVDADQAFDMLRKSSQRENLKLRDVASQIVATDAATRSAD